jgi:chromosome partitioning protein
MDMNTKNGPKRAACFLDKGGTGKTTSTAHLAVAAHRLGHEVLLIDLAGKQGDLSKQFGLWDDVQEDIANDNAFPNIDTVFKEEWSQVVDLVGGDKAAVDELTYETGEGPDLIPAHPALDGLEAELNNIADVQDRYTRLQTFLDEYVDPLQYDLVLLDLPGNTNNVAYNGLVAAGNVIAAVEMGPYEFEQAEQLFQDVESLADTLDREISVVMLLANKVEQRTKLSDAYEDRYDEQYGDVMASEAIPRSQDIRNATERGGTAFTLEEPSSTAQRARDAFEANAAELLNRL